MPSPRLGGSHPSRLGPLAAATAPATIVGFFFKLLNFETNIEMHIDTKALRNAMTTTHGRENECQRRTKANLAKSSKWEILDKALEGMTADDKEVPCFFAFFLHVGSLWFHFGSTSSCFVVPCSFLSVPCWFLSGFHIFNIGSMLVPFGFQTSICLAEENAGGLDKP